MPRVSRWNPASATRALSPCAGTTPVLANGPAGRTRRRDKAGVRLRATTAAFAAFLLAAALAQPSQAGAQLADLATIRDTSFAMAARSRELARRAGAGYERETLDAIRRSCATREVVRLDTIEPAEVTSEAAASSSASLLEIVLRGHLPPAVEPVAASSGAAEPRASAGAPADAAVERADPTSEIAFGSGGVELRRGQIRTTAAFAIPRDTIGTIELDIATTGRGHVLVGWSESADTLRLRRNHARIELIGDGRTHTYTIDAAQSLARGLSASASVRRFFVATRADAPVTVSAFRVLPRTRRYDAAYGATREMRGGELRSVLYAKPATSLAFDVAVPKENPVLEAGLGVLATGGIVEMEIAVSEGAGGEGAHENRTVLGKRLVRSGPWEDVALDLARWSGRRVRLWLSVRGVSDAVALWSSPLIRPRPGDERTEPFLLVVEDALRPDRMSVYGGPVATPAHERIAAGGVAFERAFAQAAQTRASVPSLMTSLLPSANGTWDFSDALSERYVTIAEAFRACGFATASFLQNGNAGTYAGLAQGFDVVFDEQRDHARAADLLGEGSALDRWITRQRGRPYFAYVHILDPHGPYDPVVRPDLAEAPGGEVLLRDRSIDAAWLDRPTAAARRILYDAEVAANDRALAGFFDRLEARGDLSRSVLAIVADHGEFLGEHGGLWRHHPPGHLEVARVPFLLRAPGAMPRRIARPVALLDVMPTFLDLAGIDASSLVMHGASLRNTLTGAPAPERAIPAEEMIIDEGERRVRACGSFATDSSLWLLSCTRDEDFSPGRLLASRTGDPVPLRRIALDPSNLGVEHPMSTFSQIVSERVVRGQLESFQSEGLRAWREMTAGGSQSIIIEPGTSQRLRALGYVQ